MDEIIIDNKYKFYIKDHVLCCDRYGEQWRDFCGDNAVSLLFQYCFELRKHCSKLEQKFSNAKEKK